MGLFDLTVARNKFNEGYVYETKGAKKNAADCYRASMALLGNEITGEGTELFNSCRQKIDELCGNDDTLMARNNKRGHNHHDHNVGKYIPIKLDSIPSFEELKQKRKYSNSSNKSNKNVSDNNNIINVDNNKRKVDDSILKFNLKKPIENKSVSLMKQYNRPRFHSVSGAQSATVAAKAEFELMKIKLRLRNRGKSVPNVNSWDFNHSSFKKVVDNEQESWEAEKINEVRELLLKEELGDIGEDLKNDLNAEIEADEEEIFIETKDVGVQTENPSSSSPPTHPHPVDNNIKNVDSNIKNVDGNIKNFDDNLKSSLPSPIDVINVRRQYARKPSIPRPGSPRPGQKQSPRLRTGSDAGFVYGNAMVPGKGRRNSVLEAIGNRARSNSINLMKEREVSAKGLFQISMRVCSDEDKAGDGYSSSFSSSSGSGTDSSEHLQRVKYENVEEGSSITKVLVHAPLEHIILRLVHDPKESMLDDFILSSSYHASFGQIAKIMLQLFRERKPANQVAVLKIFKRWAQLSFLEDVNEPLFLQEIMSLYSENIMDGIVLSHFWAFLREVHFQNIRTKETMLEILRLMRRDDKKLLSFKNGRWYFTGKDVLEFLRSQLGLTTREDAMILGNFLLQDGYIFSKSAEFFEAGLYSVEDTVTKLSEKENEDSLSPSSASLSSYSNILKPVENNKSKTLPPKAFSDAKKNFLGKNEGDAEVSASAANSPNPLLRRKSFALSPFNQNVAGKMSQLGKLPNSSISLLDISADEFAEQLCFYEFELFHQIEASELKHCNWMGSRKEEVSPNVLSMIRFSNKLCQWLAAEIVTTPNPRKRLAVLKQCIRIGRHMANLRNFNAVMEIMGTLQNAAVRRLKGSWGGLSSKKKDDFSKLEKLTDPSGNRKVYRQALREAVASGQPCIPYLGGILTDLTFLESNKNHVGPDKNLVNCKKIRLLGVIFRELRHLQGSRYSYLPNKELQAFFRNEMKISLSDEELFAFSTYVESPSNPINRIKTGSRARSMSFG